MQCEPGNMNYPINQDYQDTRRLPIYSLFLNPTTDEMRRTGMMNLPEETIQYGSCQRSTKPVPIGTGRPFPNTFFFDITKTNLFPSGTFQTHNIQTRAGQRFLVPSTLSMYNQNDSPFNPIWWLYQPKYIGSEQFFTATPVRIVPNQQKYNEEITCICNINAMHEKNKTIWTPLPVDRLPKLINCHGQNQSLTRNVGSQNVNQIVDQGFNNYTYQNPHIPQPFRGAYQTTPMPKQEIHGFPRQANYSFPGPAIPSVPRQNFVNMQWRNGAAMSNGVNYNGNTQAISYNRLNSGPHCSRVPEPVTEANYAARNEAKRHVFHNTYSGYRNKNKRNTYAERHYN